METGKRTKILLKDASYVAEDSPEKLHLSVQFGLDGLNAAVLDPTSNKYLCVERIPLSEDTDYSNLTQNLEAAIESSELLQQSYKSADGAYRGPHATLVPNALYEKEQQSKYLDFNFSDLPAGKIHTDTLFSIGSANVYLVPEAAAALFTQRFPNIRFHHSNTVLIETVMRQNRYSTDQAIYVNINEKDFDMLVLAGKSLQFYNSFAYQSAEDLVYYLLYVVEQLKLSPTKTPITLLGEIDRESATYEYLKQYLSQLSFGKRNWVFKYPYVFSPIAEHQSFVLLHQFQCA
jgi:hypothetical protein